MNLFTKGLLAALAHLPQASPGKYINPGVLLLLAGSTGSLPRLPRTPSPVRARYRRLMGVPTAAYTPPPTPPPAPRGVGSGEGASTAS